MAGRIGESVCGGRPGGSWTRSPSSAGWNRERPFSLATEVKPVCDLLTKYADVPMSLADACLVRMSEMYPKHRVMTLDADFRIYRRRRNQALPLLMPA